MKTADLYRRIRTRKAHTATSALRMARDYIAGPFAQFQADLAAWNAQPDKRRYAPGGYENRPKLSAFYPSKESTPIDGLRDCGNVNAIFPRLFDHSGWYADTDCETLYCGQVWQLPARNGQVQYLAGYVEPASGCVVFVTYDDGTGTPEIFAGDNPGNSWDDPEALKDAARAADALAESDAETEREYRERWDEASQKSDAREEARAELKAARADARKVMAASRNTFDGAILAILRDKVIECRAGMRRAIAAIAAATDAIADVGMEGEF